MRILVVGTGGREHTLAWRLARSDSAREVVTLPGNGGTALAGWSVGPGRIVAGDQLATIEGLEPDLVVIGPEAPLVEGVADRLRQRGIAVFGPGADGARLEGSKVFSKRFMQKYDLPTARCREVTGAADLESALTEMGDTVVLKVDGLAAGKGVVLPDTREEALAVGRGMLDGTAFGEAGSTILVEERVEGYEISLLAVCDGRDYFLLPASQDHKRALEGDKGPNTGGMGAYSPVPQVTDRELTTLADEIFGGTLNGLRAEGIDYRGVLYAGLMITAAGPRLLEYNCRFGDPETQAVLPRLDGDFAALLAGAAAGELESDCVSIRPGAAITTVLASAGYPGKYRTGFEITGLNDDIEDTLVFHAGTALEDGKVITTGGRVLAVTALGDNLQEAAQRCYQRIESIQFQGRTLRTDIGWRALRSEGGS